ncbi:MAG: hypothetical protein E7455_02305 [Ruminococcaceae bacterium]|nr:hypothetical protein [Oscillospiraceae bacterium]
MKIKKLLLCLLSVALLLCMLPVGAFAVSDPPSQAGERELEGGQRDFLWPVPGNYNLTSCYLDNREHYSLDMDGEMGDSVVASYKGTVDAINTDNGSTGWGNYVLLQHAYVLKGGSTVTLYSRYAHLKDVLVAVGDTVTAGQKIGTVGATGSVSTATGDGSHLDYDIMYESTSNSVDPYINELLELPAGIYTTSGSCCQKYVAYIKEFYGSCAHKTYNEEGLCTECGEAYDWESTKNVSKQGYYSAQDATEIYKQPYKTAESIKVLSAGEEIAVNGTVTNAAKEAWYEVEFASGSVAYVPKSAMTFVSYFESEITGELTTLTEGQVLKPNPHRLDGKITSRYPLKKVIGYLDGKWCGSWSGDGKTRELWLRNTEINTYVSFGKLAPGKHTLLITATDTTSQEAFQVISCTFYIANGTEDMITVTYATDPEEQVSLFAGQALGELPVPQREGGTFLGWYTDPEEGELVTEETVPAEDITLYPRWEMAVYTVSFETQILYIPHGGFITEFPEYTQEGYRLVGWATSEGREITGSTPITSDLILYPQWEMAGYVLTLDPKGGELSETQIEVFYGETYGKLPTPTREGYVFQGWRLGGQVITADTLVEIDGDHTAVAVWGKEEPKTDWILPTVLVVAVLAIAAVTVHFILIKRAQEEDWE